MAVWHAHTTAACAVICHSHAKQESSSSSPGHGHVHEDKVFEAEASRAGSGAAAGAPPGWHEHILGDGAAGLHIRHAHSHAAAIGHTHDGEPLQDVLLLPPRPTGVRVLFPAWTALHPWWHLWPVPHIRPSHAKAHFNSSGVDDVWPGALTVLTQSFKAVVGVAAWFRGRGGDDGFYTNVVWAIAVVSVIMATCWVYIWPRGRVNIVLTLINYVLYITGWSLSVKVLYNRLEPVYHIPAELALLPVLVPPVYVSVRTLLFFPSSVRRRRFLLAALSNRAVPLELNMYVVGPSNTWLSHAFLTMLNSYAMLTTLASKIVVFSLERPTGLAAFVHVAHLASTWWASLYGIRCRQIALDTYAVVETKLGAEASTIGSQRACGSEE